MTAMTTTTKSTDKTADKSLNKADKDKAAAKVPIKDQPARTTPWQDLAATPSMQKEPRDKTVLACALKLLRERGREGATLEEIKESFKEINMFHHDPKALLTWASKNRGWGFHQKKDGRIILVTKSADE